MPGRPSKPVDLMILTGTKHMTKEEIEQRRAAEAALITGKRMKIWPEVNADKIAREEFERVAELLGIIDKDDALQEGVVNRYCLLRSECVGFEKKREIFMRSLAELKREYKADKLLANQYFTLVGEMQRNIVNIDRQVMSKRNMMLAIEKENLMTIASALRSIPKKLEKKKKEGGMAAFMAKRDEYG